MSDKADTIKFFADKCIGLATITFLKGLGYSVVKAKEAGLRGKPDTEILQWSIEQGRILITEDMDFGNILLYPPKLHHCIILLKFRHRQEADIHSTLTTLLDELKLTDFKGSLIIVDANKYRLRKE